VTIWLLMFDDVYVGTFFCGAYSNEALADVALAEAKKRDPSSADCYSVEEHVMDTEFLEDFKEKVEAP
jgi:hypothetical protein